MNVVPALDAQRCHCPERAIMKKPIPLSAWILSAVIIERKREPIRYPSQETGPADSQATSPNS